MSIKQIIQESINKNPLGLKEALEAELRSRVALAIEAKVAESEHEDEEDDEEDEEEELDEKKLSDKDIKNALASVKAKPKSAVSLKKPPFKMD
jgi:rRNA maturation endonuclease Nob1